MNETEATDSWFSKRVEGQLKDLANESRDVSPAAIVFVSIFALIVLYFTAHQTWSTGFFTAKFGTLEMLLLYGSLVEWIVVGARASLLKERLQQKIWKKS